MSGRALVVFCCTGDCCYFLSFAANNCYLNDDGSANLIGSFDTSTDLFASLSTQQLAFAVDQQQFLQGYVPVAIAALYVTTGMLLNPPVETDGVLMSGPSLITKESPPSDTWQTCQVDAFPVCPNTKDPSGQPSNCACTDRAGIVIGGVLHGHTADRFWDLAFAGS